jgi:DNA relaxase NicK
MNQKTTIDWFGFRTKDGPDVITASLSDCFSDRFQVTVAPRKTGWRSFEKSYDLWLTDIEGNPDADCVRIGMVMTGGDAVKGWTLASIDGRGCSWVDDWGRTMDVCTETLKTFDLKRVDVALDRYDGSHFDDVDLAWSAGEFCPPGGGKKPKAKPIASRRQEDGQTYYVGSRESAKFYRGYEKGLQILGPLLTAANDRDPSGLTAANLWMKREVRLDTGPDGTRTPLIYSTRDWWRDEVEFKPVNQPLPLDLVENRDQYFSGAFPYLGKVLPTVDVQMLCTRRDRMPQIELAKMLDIIRGQYGSSLYTALHAYGGDIGAVWDKIVGKKHNKALIEAGVLLVDHE